MIFPRYTDKKWRVSHAGGSSADLVDTRSLDFSNGEQIGTRDKATVLYTNTDDSNVGILLAIPGTESVYYFVSSDGIYSTADGITFLELTTSSRPNIRLNTDAVIFGGNLVVSGDNSVGYYDGSWHSGVTSLSTSYPHPLCVYETGNSTGPTLAVGNGNVVTTYSTGYALQSTLTIPVEYVVTWIRARSNNLYIGTRNVSGGGAKFFVWNGSSTGAQFYYGVEADWIYSGCEYDNGIAVITSAGQLLHFTGGGFTELENLPVYDTPYSWSSSSAIANGIGKVANRGMIAKGKNLYINIDGSITIANSAGYPSTYMVNQPSGLWEYNSIKGLSHSAGYPYSKYTTLSITDVATNALVFSATHGCVTGDPVYCSNATGLSGLTTQQTYYAIVLSTTVMQLALTPGDANAGKYLTISGTPSGAAVYVDTLDSIGATAIVNPGAVGLINTIVPNTFFASKLFFGGSTKNASNTTAYLFMGLGMGRNRGYLVTNTISSDAVTDDFKNIYTNIVKLSQATDSIQTKYKLGETIEYPTMASQITWTSSTVFTITTNTGVDFANAMVGDEVLVVSGAGAGYAAHISTIAQSGTTYTVTLDEEIPLIVNGNISTIIVDNWTKLDAITATNDHLPEGFGKVPLGKYGSELKLKFELRGRDLITNRIALAESSKQPIT